MRKLAEPNLDERRFYFYTDFVRGVNSSGNVIQSGCRILHCLLSASSHSGRHYLSSHPPAN